MKNTTPDQLKLLEAVRTSLNITEDMHLEIEAEVKRELEPPMPDVPPVPMPERDMNLLIEPEEPEPSRPTTKSRFLKEVKAKKYLTLGKEKYRRNNYEDALNLFIQGQMAAPDNEEFLFLIKKVKLKINQERRRAQVEIDAVPTVNGSEQSARVAIPIENPTPNSINPAPSTLPAEAQPAPAAIPVDVQSAPTKTEIQPETESKVDTPSSTCISCKGTGKCYWCNGTGHCDRCEGSGKYNGGNCAMCGSSGKCNSCDGEGTCMWCHGSGAGEGKKKNRIYTS